MLKSLQVRKFIAVVLIIAFIVMSVLAFVLGRPLPEPFTMLVVSVVAYYFGKSTALEQPKYPTDINLPPGT